MKKYLVVALLLTSVPAWAALPHGATPAEVAMCEARGMPGGQGRYQGHYCDGLRFLDRAYASMANKQDMRYYLQVAIDNFNYMLSHSAEADARRGEFHIGKARALKLLGRNAEAAAEFNKALNYKISSPDVYLALADYYHEAGNKQKALKWVTEGLQRTPNSKGLKRRYTEFGGKLPYPAPIEPAPVETQAAKPDEAVAPTPIPASPVEPATDRPTTAAPVAEPVAPPKIGSPKNPYCRFCTD